MNSDLRSGGPNDSITLVATTTVDEVPQEDGTVLGRPGGPATYVGGALIRLGVAYCLITGARPTVKVIIRGDGEQYVIPSIPRIELPPRLAGRAAILSPIMREIDPNGIPPVDGLLAVDIQGFVREPGVPTGSLHRTFNLSRLIRQADIVKAGSQEMLLLDHDSRAALEDRIVIETHGERGAVIRDRHGRYSVRGEVVCGVDTIGAGDNFLAAFVVALLDGATPAVAGQAAADFTSTFLRERAGA